MAHNRKLWIALAIGGSFSALAALTLFLLAANLVNFATALLILIAMIGLYIGFGILFAAWHLVNRLD